MFRLDRTLTSETFDSIEAAKKFKGWVEKLGGQAARDLRTARTDDLDSETLKDWFDRYLLTLTGVTAGTVAEYERLAKRTWLSSLGELPLEALSRDHVTAWVGIQAKTLTIRGTPTAAKTIKNAHNLLSQVVSAAVEEGIRPGNPCRGVDLPKGTREEMVFLTQSEFARLYGEIPAFWQPLVMTLAGTGMRWGEATAVQWRDLDLDADVPVVRVSRAWKKGASTKVLGPPKTPRSRRTISLPPEVVRELRTLRGSGEEFVFTAQRGGVVHHQMFRPRVWRPAVIASKLGKQPRIHDLRHSHASWLIADGVNLSIVQRRLGHESIATTVDVYGHLAGDALGIAADAASRALQLSAPVLSDDSEGDLPSPLAITGLVPDVEGGEDPGPMVDQDGTKGAADGDTDAE